MYRQFKYIECLSSLLRTLKHKNSVLRVLLSGRYMALMAHHMLDQIVFLQAMGVFRNAIGKEKLLELKKKTLAAWWIRYSGQHHVYRTNHSNHSIWFQLAADFCIYYCDRKLSQAYEQECDYEKKKELREQVKERKKAHFRLVIDILKNLFDFPCAMEGALKRGTFHNGQVGAMAVISSLFGLYLAYPK